MSDIPDFKRFLPDIPDSISSHLRLMQEIQRPNLSVPVIRTEVQDNYASEFYKRLVAWINDFNEALDQEHEVGVTLVSFG